MAEAAAWVAVVEPDDSAADCDAVVPDGPGDVARGAAGLVGERGFGAGASQNQGTVAGPAVEDGWSDGGAGAPFQPRQGSVGGGRQGRREGEDEGGQTEVEVEGGAAVSSCSSSRRCSSGPP